MQRLRIIPAIARARKTDIRGAAKTVAIMPTGAKEPKRWRDIGAVRIWADVEAESDDESLGGKMTEKKRCNIFEKTRIPARAP